MKLDGQQIDLIFQPICDPEALRLQRALDRSMQGPIAPNTVLEANLRRYLRIHDLEALAVSSWWLGDFGFLLRESILERTDDLLVRLCCEAKYGSIEFLQAKLSERDFFGNFIPRVKKLVRKLQVLFRRQRPARRIPRRRGYRDHGTLRPSHRWVENSDWSLREEMLAYEDYRYQREQDYLALLGEAGFAT
jgi:hypothetical protein